MRETVKSGDNELRDRIYDAWAEIDGVLTKVEAKSWIASGMPANVRTYLLGKGKVVGDKKEYLGEGAQLLMDLMSYAQQGFTGHKWVFHKDMAESKDLFKTEVFKNLSDNPEIRDRLMGYLKKDEEQFKLWIKELKLNFSGFYEVLE